MVKIRIFKEARLKVNVFKLEGRKQLAVSGPVVPAAVEAVLVVLFVVVAGHESAVEEVAFAQIFGRVSAVLGARQNGHLEELGVGYVVVGRVQRVEVAHDVVRSGQEELVGEAADVGGECADDKVRVGQEEDVE